MTNQTDGFAEFEGLRYVTARQDQDGPTMLPEDFNEIPLNAVASVLDAGCGIGLNLDFAIKHFTGARGVGIEPSHDAVVLLRDRYHKEPSLTFEVGALHALPFPTSSFDLVICWSVLHWVGRNEYLQSVGELIRVARKFILVMDFFSAVDYRVTYAHREGMFTFKQDFQPLFESSGITQTIWCRLWEDMGHGNPRGSCAIEDFTPFLANERNYRGRKSCLFQKSHDLLPTLAEADFQSRT
jgi:SAM-dependent methyltransferase